MDIEREAWQVYATLVTGGVAVVPTNAGYGLLAMGPQGVRRIYEMKGRPKTKPCVLVTTWRVFDDVAAPIDPEVREWIVDTIRWTPLAVVTRLNVRSRMLACLDPFVRAPGTRDARAGRRSQSDLGVPVATAPCRPPPPPADPRHSARAARARRTDRPSRQAAATLRTSRRAAPVPLASHTTNRS